MMFGTRPSEQRKGYGRKLLLEALARVGRNKSIGLGTQSQQNVDFYASVGFEVTGYALYTSCQVNGWTMRLKPSSS